MRDRRKLLAMAVLREDCPDFRNATALRWFRRRAPPLASRPLALCAARWRVWPQGACALALGVPPQDFS
jgi:hypothetical protein